MSDERSKPRRLRLDAPAVACFGEILWDCLPRGLFLGGAPLNVAYHLGQQQLRVLPVTAVGRDFLGDEALRRVAAWNVDGRFVARVPGRPTGHVRASLDRAGVADYEIARDVAWDRIPIGPALLRIDPAPAAVVFGTLALRSPANRRTLASLLTAWPNALPVVDLNFRPPFDSATAVNFALRHARLVKLNEHELAQLAGSWRRKEPASLERGARRLSAHHRICRICVTAGDRGAGLLWDGEWFWEDARPVQVRDTVGAGDAFLAGLLGALLARSASPHDALAQACRLGEFVASQDGATPAYEFYDVIDPTERAGPSLSVEAESA
ncbi:MAG TPA: PfkB family carbohydrate kinase [Opitutus sp.]|nr:PfkB family carbohydrate kinase [Opitutus sp.]